MRVQRDAGDAAAQGHLSRPRHRHRWEDDLPDHSAAHCVVTAQLFEQCAIVAEAPRATYVKNVESRLVFVHESDKFRR